MLELIIYKYSYQLIFDFYIFNIVKFKNIIFYNNKINRLTNYIFNKLINSSNISNQIN